MVSDFDDTLSQILLGTAGTQTLAIDCALRHPRLKSRLLVGVLLRHEIGQHGF